MMAFRTWFVRLLECPPGYGYFEGVVRLVFTARCPTCQKPPTTSGTGEDP